MRCSQCKNAFYDVRPCPSYSELDPLSELTQSLSTCSVPSARRLTGRLTSLTAALSLLER